MPSEATTASISRLVVERRERLAAQSGGDLVELHGRQPPSRRHAPRSAASIERAARRPAPMALMTVAAPVTTSPPAQTRSREVRPVASSATMVPRLPTSRPGRGHGDQRVGAVADGAHRGVHRHAGTPSPGSRWAGGGPRRRARPAPCAGTRSPRSQPRSSPMRRTGRVRKSKITPSSSAFSTSSSARRQLVAAAAVDDVDLLGAQAQRRAGRVHGHVAAAEHGHLRRPLERRVAGREAKAAHEVAAREVLVGGVHAVQVLAGDLEEPRQAGAGAHEDGVERFEQTGRWCASCRPRSQGAARRPGCARTRPRGARWPWAGGTRGCRR